MKPFALTLLLSASGALLTSSVSAGAPPSGPTLQGATSEQELELAWYTDVDEARRVAAKTGKHVLVDFTGTGWCSWCKKLDAEVLSTSVFAESVATRFVVVRVDFDRSGNARADLPFAGKNNALKEALGVNAFPTVSLMTASGIPYGESGYERGGPGAYTDKLAAAHAEAVHLEASVPRLAAAITSAKSKDDATLAADEAIELLANAGPHALAVPLIPIVRAMLKVPDLAPEREAKVLLALAGANVVDAELIDHAFRADPKNKSGLPEAALAAAMRTLSGPDAVDPLIKRIEAMLGTMIVHDKEVAAQLYGDCAYWIKTWQQDTDRSRAMASFALRLNPTDPDLRSMLQDLAGQ